MGHGCLIHRPGANLKRAGGTLAPGIAGLLDTASLGHSFLRSAKKIATRVQADASFPAQDHMNENAPSFTRDFVEGCIDSGDRNAPDGTPFQGSRF